MSMIDGEMRRKDESPQDLTQFEERWGLWSEFEICRL